MNILHISYHSSPLSSLGSNDGGGLSTYVHELCNILSSENTVQVISTEDSTNKKKNNYSINTYSHVSPQASMKEKIENIGIFYSDFISSYTGISLILVCFLAVMFNSGILSAENMLLAKFTPQKHHGIIYGLKFILAFGAGPLAVYYVSKVYEFTQEFVILFISCSIIALITAILAFFLPIKDKIKQVV